jgi:hypothetical protein
MKTTVIVRFVSGREERFEMEFWNTTRVETRLQALVEKPNLILRLSDEVLLIPGSAVECISIKIPEEDNPFDLSQLNSATRIG